MRTLPTGRSFHWPATHFVGSALHAALSHKPNPILLPAKRAQDTIPSMISGPGRASLAVFCAQVMLCAQAPATLEPNKTVRQALVAGSGRSTKSKAGQNLEAVVEEKGITIQVL
jgi:hypothetical protein